MKLEKISIDEYEEFAKKHKYSSFIQNTKFAELKKKNRWNYVILGLKENKKLIAGVALHYKNIKFGKKIFYAPRGYLLDYENFELFQRFDSLICQYAKKEGGIVLKIDPYLINKERDKDAQVIDKGVNNINFVNLLKKLGYKKEAQKPLQAEWMYWIKIKDKSYEDIMSDMTSKTRQMIRKNEKNGVVIREGGKKDLEEFRNILNKTGDRRGFVSRPLKYFEDMYECFSEDNNFRLIFADLKIQDKLDELIIEQKELISFLEKVSEDKKLGKNKVGEKKILEKEKEISQLNEKISTFRNLNEKYGDTKCIGGIIYLNYGREVLSFIGGAYEEFMEYQPFYTIHHEMLKYAISNNYEIYNFYGISGNFDPKDPMYGVYQFKRGFGGQVVELIGEYDKKLSPIYYLYKLAYKFYRMKK